MLQTTRSTPEGWKCGPTLAAAAVGGEFCASLSWGPLCARPGARAAGSFHHSGAVCERRVVRPTLLFDVDDGDSSIARAGFQAVTASRAGQARAPDARWGEGEGQR